jgi:hypothetical protein
MAIDYFLTFPKFGSNDNKARVREFLLQEFSFVDHADTEILTKPGLSVSVFVDDDTEDLTDVSNRQDLVVSFRIAKHEESIRLGYMSMRRIVKRFVRLFDVDLHIGDELDQYIYLTKVADKVVAQHQDHDFWTVGVELE